MNGWHRGETSNKNMVPKSRVIVGIDGSVYTHLKPFREGLRRAIVGVLGEEGAGMVELQVCGCIHGCVCVCVCFCVFV